MTDEVDVRNFDDYAGLARVESHSVDEDDDLPEEVLSDFRELRAMVRALVQLLVEKEVVSLEDVAERAMAAEPKRLR